MLVAAALAAAAGPAAAAVAADRLRVPPGFRIELWTDAVPNARALALGRWSAESGGTVYVGSFAAGTLAAVEFDNQGRAAAVHTLARGLRAPGGVAWRDGRLYVSAVSRIVVFDDIDRRLADPPAPRVLVDDLPTEGHHGLKPLAFGPDGFLYVATGAPCNVCLVDQAHAVIQRMRPEGGPRETVATGVRNSVGFDWSPVDQALWFTDNGRDLMGDDVPSDELNRAPDRGRHYGFPYCHQGDTPDPEFGTRRPCRDFVAPAARLGAHVAALGMRFYRGSAFPAAYRHNVFVAEHGSWNRSRRSGYRVVRVVVDGAARVERQEAFVEGWLQTDAAGNETVLGRPADVLELPDGSLLVSDDLGGAIYRVRWAPP